MASILEQTTNNADARLIQVVGDPEIAGAQLIRGWPEIAGSAASGNAVEDLFTTLNAVTTLYTDPQANGSVYSGKWVNSEIKALDEFERGGAMRNCAIVQMLTKVSQVASSTDLLALTARVKKHNWITHAEELNYGEHTEYTYIYENLDPSAETVLMDTITDKQLLVGLPLGASEPTDWAQNTAYSAGDIREDPTDNVVYICRVNHTSTATGVMADDFREGNWAHYWSYVDRKFQNNRDHTATFMVVFRLTAYLLSGNEEIGWQNETKTRDEKETILYPNVDGYNAQLIFDDAKTNADDMTAATPAAPVDHVLETIRRVPAGDGSYNVTRVTVNSGGELAEAWPNTAKDYAVKHIEYRRVANTSGVMVEQKRTWTGNESRRHLILQSAAAQHCSGGIDFMKAGWDTHYTMVGRNRYVAVKYTIVDSGSWADL